MAKNNNRDDESISSSVNTQPKQKKLNNNPFKKQKGPLRDGEGKFAATTGSGGLSLNKKLNWKRATPLIVVIALVGGFFVYQSFAATSSIGPGGMVGGYDTRSKNINARLLTPSNSTLIVNGLASPGRSHQVCVEFSSGSGVRRFNLTYTMDNRRDPYFGVGAGVRDIPGEACVSVGAGNPGTGTLVVTQVGDGATYITRAFIK